MSTAFINWFAKLDPLIIVAAWLIAATYWSGNLNSYST